MSLKFITAEEAASYIENDENVGFGGFTAAGTPKVVSVAIAKKAEKEHAAGRPFKIGVFTGASTSDNVDGVLSRAKAIKTRTPYQSTKDSRTAINNNEIVKLDEKQKDFYQDLAVANEKEFKLTSYPNYMTSVNETLLFKLDNMIKSIENNLPYYLADDTSFFEAVRHLAGQENPVQSTERKPKHKGYRGKKY